MGILAGNDEDWIEFRAQVIRCPRSVQKFRSLYEKRLPIMQTTLNSSSRKDYLHSLSMFILPFSHPHSRVFCPSRFQCASLAVTDCADDAPLHGCVHGAARLRIYLRAKNATTAGDFSPSRSTHARNDK